MKDLEDQVLFFSLIEYSLLHGIGACPSETTPTAPITYGRSVIQLNAYRKINALQERLVLAQGGNVRFTLSRGASLIRKRPPLITHSKAMPRALRWSWGEGRFLMSEVPL